jgi:hypothetical protein
MSHVETGAWQVGGVMSHVEAGAWQVGGGLDPVNSRMLLIGSQVASASSQPARLMQYSTNGRLRTMRCLFDKMASTSYTSLSSLSLAKVALAHLAINKGPACA